MYRFMRSKAFYALERFYLYENRLTSKNEMIDAFSETIFIKVSR